MGLLEYILEPQVAVVFVLGLTIVTGVIVENLKKVFGGWVRQQSWYERMLPLQRNLMKNFGYKESECDDETCLDSYCFVVCICGHHFLMSLAMVPVVVLGWEDAGDAGRLMFVLGALGDAAYSVYDSVSVFLRTFFPGTFCKYLGVKSPLMWFIVIVVLHHTLAIGLTTPMVMYYPSMRAFHFIIFSLLLAAGICFLAGSYKFTLDVNSKRDFRQYKAIVVLQLVTIWITRCFIWFSQAYAAVTTFYAIGDKAFFVGSALGASCMSVFNILMIADATEAAVKWLPKPMPTTEDEMRQLRRALSDENLEPASPRSRNLLAPGKTRKRGVQIVANVNAHKAD